MSRRSQPADAEESIYSLIAQPQQTSHRPEIYRSKYPHDTPPTGSTFGASTATTIMTTNLSGDYSLHNANNDNKKIHSYRKDGALFGSHTEHYSDPTQWQKKHTTRNLPQPCRFAYSSTRKPALSTHHSPDSPVTVSRQQHNSTQKNFITENALAVIMAAARRPAQNSIDYLNKPDYGKVPEYLNNVKEEINAEKQYIQNVLQSERDQQTNNQPRTQLLPENERFELLRQLKLKWEAINKSYQTITHMVTLDTMGKVRRKEQYENELNSLEKSIEKLSKPFVFVQG